jgi:glucose/mannose-6-phosphate isomerase
VAEPLADLDHPGQFTTIDHAGMLARILALPQQIRDAWEHAQRATLPRDWGEASQIVMCGMGGSAIGGDLTRSLVEREARVPIMVVRGYDLPGFVGPQSLVVLTSFSGSTEETLSSGAQARKAGARVVAITTGGVLAEQAHSVPFPVIQFSYGGTPREAIGFSTLIMLGLLSRLGYVRDYGGDVERSVALLSEMVEDLGPQTPTPDNAAKTLAQRLAGRTPIVYGGGFMAEVARRWKGQFNENAKSWSFFEQLPELDHNAVLGYRFPGTAAEQHVVVVLSSALNHPRITLREELTGKLLAQAHVPMELVAARGNSPLEHVLSAAYVGDFVSYYLALLNGVDPSEMDVLDSFKKQMARGAPGEAGA